MYSSQEAFYNYLYLQKKYSVHTVNAYLSDIKKFEIHLNSNFSTKIENASYVDIRSWIVSMSEEGIANTSINRKISSLKAFYKFLMRIDQIKINPLLKHKSLKEAKKIQIPFSENEMDFVLENLDFINDFVGLRNKAIILLFYLTGIRRAELISLKESNLDFHNKYLKVLGKRNKERLIPLTAELVNQIQMYLEVRNSLSEGLGVTEYLFISKRGVKLSETFVYKLINSYFSKASSKSKKSPHVLRHTFATHLLNNGADLNSVKELLGHSSLASTQVYTHSSLTELKKVYRDSHPRSKS